MTVLVSGAAGSVGAMACQMARIAGCRVIAVAGGPEKCRWLKEDVGAEVAIDYRSADLPSALKHASPDGINIFRSEEHTSELQSLMRISYAVFCLKKKKTNIRHE